MKDEIDAYGSLDTENVLLKDLAFQRSQVPVFPQRPKPHDNQILKSATQRPLRGSKQVNSFLGMNDSRYYRLRYIY